MSITGILIAAACVGIVGIFVGLFLGVAGIKFKVEVDEKEEAAKKLLRSWEWRLELPNVRWRMFTARETAIGRRRIMIITASRTAV